MEKIMKLMKGCIGSIYSKCLIYLRNTATISGLECLGIDLHLFRFMRNIHKMSSPKKKNFSPEEKRIFERLIQPHVETLRSLKKDAKTKEEKKKIWSRIVSDFNETSTEVRLNS